MIDRRGPILRLAAGSQGLARWISLAIEDSSRSLSRFDPIRTAQIVVLERIEQRVRRSPSVGQCDLIVQRDERNFG